MTAGTTQLFSSRRDAAEYLVCELLRTVWAGVAMNLHPPRVSAVAWVALFLPAVAGATAIDLRAKQLTQRPHGASTSATRSALRSR